MAHFISYSSVDGSEFAGQLAKSLEFGAPAFKAWLGPPRPPARSGLGRANRRRDPRLRQLAVGDDPRQHPTQLCLQARMDTRIEIPQACHSVEASSSSRYAVPSGATAVPSTSPATSSRLSSACETISLGSGLPTVSSIRSMNAWRTFHGNSVAQMMPAKPAWLRRSLVLRSKSKTPSGILDGLRNRSQNRNQRRFRSLQHSMALRPTGCSTHSWRRRGN